ncbi:hypothetical protein ACHAXA_006895 [Cyclostephanos tholiformis]|uniref:Uncharacterized protein n=1 Tax=Cyclostephanos tholiformis TaxID=382380 RepID=A0ABD3SD54_9STRA
MMRSAASPSLLLLVVVIAVASRAKATSASIFLQGGGVGAGVGVGVSERFPTRTSSYHRRRCLDRALRRHRCRIASSFSDIARRPILAMAIPGNSLPEQIIIGGFGNFISIYNTVITGRILLSWFPQAAGVGALRPIYQITDPYLNLFRGIIPPIFGLDFSPILAFVTLNLLQTSSVSLAAMTDDCDISDGGKKGTMVAAAAMTKQKVMGEEGKCNKKKMG